MPVPDGEWGYKPVERFGPDKAGVWVHHGMLERLRCVNWSEILRKGVPEPPGYVETVAKVRARPKGRKKGKAKKRLDSICLML